MSVAFDHGQRGTPEPAWAGGGLDRLPELTTPAADASVLVVAAHPDDESLGAGGVIAQAVASGADVAVLVASDGEASHPQSPTYSPRRLATVRRAEVAAALAALGGSVRVEFLGLPDGALTAHRGQLVAAVEHRLSGRTHVISPWRGDGHPDHEVCADAVREAIGTLAGIEHWQYPIWGWHWGRPRHDDEPGDASVDLPWSSMARLELGPAAAAAKQAAVACHVSQHAALSPAPGDEPILPPHMLAHFTRAFETFVVEPIAPATDPGYFDALYASSDDPWELGRRFYETRKRALLVASLPRNRFARAFEPGCATGLLTADLARRCDEVLAWDGAESAVRQARDRLPGPGVVVEQRRIPEDWPTGTFDLIVLSEVGYYCADLGMLAGRVRATLAADGVVVACHWSRGAPDHPHSAREVHDALGVGLRPIAMHREDDFLLDVWSTSGASVAVAEGIVDAGDRP